MPKITIFDESRKLNAVTGFRSTPDTTSAQGSAKLAQGISQAGNAVGQFANKRRELESRQEAQKITLEAEQRLEAEIERLKQQGLSSRDFEAQSSKASQKILAESRQRLGKAGGLLGLKQAHQDFVENTLGTLEGRSSLSIARESRKMFVAEATANDKRIQQQQEDIEARAPEDQAASRRAIRHQSIQAGVGTIRNQEQADLEIAESDRRVVIGRTELEIHQDPAKVLEQLEGDPPKELRSGDIDTLRNKAVARQNTIKARELELERRQDKQHKEAQRRVYDTSFAQALDGKLTFEEAVHLNRQEMLVGEGYRDILRITNSGEFLSGRGNPGEAKKAALAIRLGQITRPAQISAMTGVEGGLNATQAIKLLDVLRGVEVNSKVYNDPAFKSARSQIMNALSPKGTGFRSNNAKEAEIQNRAIRQFEARSLDPRNTESYVDIAQDVISTHRPLFRSAVEALSPDDLRTLLGARYLPDTQPIELDGFTIIKEIIYRDVMRKKLTRLQGEIKLRQLFELAEMEGLDLVQEKGRK